MPVRRFLLAWVSLSALFSLQALCNDASQPAAASAPVRSYSDQWVAVDGAGRTLPTHAQAGGPRERYVGLFYWLWHADIRIPKGKLKTMNALIAENPKSPAFECKDYYWGEMEAGFYHPSDPWVIRRNLQMFANAGVDFIFIDFTNYEHGHRSVKPLFEIALDMQARQIPVPKVVFFLNSTHKAPMKFLLTEVYSKKEYESLFFKWEGKPLIMADRDKAEKELKEIGVDTSGLQGFTWRKTWAFNDNLWNFISHYPQKVFLDQNAAPEQMPVSKGMGAPTQGDWYKKGSSYHNGKAPKYDEYWACDQSGFGHYFEEQWNHAHKVAPKIVTLTGWNELTAAPWPNTISFMNKPWNHEDWRCVSPETCLSKNPEGSHKWPHGWAMIDQFNTEFNRDCEPMKGGYTDNYYYQMVAHIRRFKGMTPPAKVSKPKTVTVDGKFSEWSNVTPVFKDAPGDVINRDFQNVNNSERYVNNTARNDIIESRVTYDEKNVYFYVKTLKAMTPYTDKNWMTLFIDTDRNKKTGWEGYDWVVNYKVTSADKTTLVGKGRTFEVAYSQKGEQMEIAIPRTPLGMTDTVPAFCFHWADNMQHTKDVTAFFTDGESAPDRRFDYCFAPGLGKHAGEE